MEVLGKKKGLVAKLTPCLWMIFGSLGAIRTLGPLVPRIPCYAKLHKKQRPTAIKLQAFVFILLAIKFR